ncbi:MAG TPA: tail fiber domain-containing protein, partial [candidate division Zixibacteria bacterium]|nr:tail fiber domain-containing protein [candidate division Zixibacteria bacterium]
STVEKLNPVKYHWRQKEYPERHFTSGEQIGLIAQEVKEILPQVVSQGSDGMYSLDYAHLTPVLISAVKKQQQEITSLKDRLAKLEAQMNQLTQAMSSNGSPMLGQK